MPVKWLLQPVCDGVRRAAALPTGLSPHGLGKALEGGWPKWEATSHQTASIGSESTVAEVERHSISKAAAC